MLGEELDHISDEELSKNMDLYSILQSKPVAKQRIVKVLKSKGHTVGFMGDGINDAAAIKEADVGISVDTGPISLKKVPILSCWKRPDGLA